MIFFLVGIDAFQNEQRFFSHLWRGTCMWHAHIPLYVSVASQCANEWFRIWTIDRKKSHTPAQFNVNWHCGPAHEHTHTHTRECNPSPGRISILYIGCVVADHCCCCPCIKCSYMFVCLLMFVHQLQSCFILSKNQRTKKKICKNYMNWTK